VRLHSVARSPIVRSLSPCESVCTCGLLAILSIRAELRVVAVASGIGQGYCGMVVVVSECCEVWRLCLFVLVSIFQSLVEM